MPKRQGLPLSAISCTIQEKNSVTRITSDRGQEISRRVSEAYLTQHNVRISQSEIPWDIVDAQALQEYKTVL